MKNAIPDSLISAISNDNVEKVEQIIKMEPQLFNSKNDIGWTILHCCAIWGSDKVFEWLYPQLTKPKLNMFDKHDKTPFHRAITGPSDKIFETLLKDGKVDVTKCKNERRFAVKKNEAIFDIIPHPEYKHRAIQYFDFVDNPSTKWQDWFEQSMFEGRQWAIKLVFDQKKYNTVQDYYKFQGIKNAIRGDQKKVIEYVCDRDKSILESTESGSPLSESLRWPERFKYLIGLMPNKLDNPSSGMYYDSLVNNILRYENMKEYLDIVNERDILISEELIINMINSGNDNEIFFESCILRSDYSSFIIPLLVAHDKECRFLPTSVKDIFVF